MQTPEDYVNDMISGKLQLSFIEAISARDAEWQARVDRLTAALVNLTVSVEKHDFLSCALVAQTQDARAAIAESEAAHE